MRVTRGAAATAALGILAMLCTPAAGRAQGVSAEPLGRIASLAPGGIEGVVLDERGAPLAGAMVSALGATTKVAVTDTSGRFVLRTLSPGPYVLRAHLTGYVASPAQIVEVRPSTRASSSIALRHITKTGDEPLPVLAAGVGSFGAPSSDPDVAVSPAGGDDHGETAWRIRHARRGVLKDAELGDLLAGDETLADDGGGAAAIFGRAVSSPARAASALFAGAPFSGQLNLLTTGSFDTPQQLFTTDSFARGVAYLSVGSSLGSRADWSARAALTQGDISSWIVAGSYATRATGRHHYDIGMSYATQRYDGGNPVALRSVTDGSRNAGAVYGVDSWTFGRVAALSYGGRYSSYGYLDGRGLFSPRATVTVAPASKVRLVASVASRAVAPGAEEFLPPADGDVWLPPQRTFSAFVPGHAMVAERNNSANLELQRDLGTSTVSVEVFRQVVENQLVTVFGAAAQGQPEMPGHYFVGNNGNVDVTGWRASWSAAVTGRLHAAVRYSLGHAQWSPTADLAYLVLVAPSAMRQQTERIQDVTASVETTVPETATRVLVLYRVSNGFASRDLQTPGIDSRFDVQVRQSLPFMNFSATQWEMLVAVRNFFREEGIDQSIYDEMLVVHPPKRIVGGLTLRF